MIIPEYSVIYLEQIKRIHFPKWDKVASYVNFWDLLSLLFRLKLSSTINKDALFFFNGHLLN